MIRKAMRKTGMVALGRLVMSTRERICVLKVEEDALLMTSAGRPCRSRSAASRPADVDIVGADRPVDGRSSGRRGRPSRGDQAWSPRPAGAPRAWTQRP